MGYNIIGKVGEVVKEQSEILLKIAEFNPKVKVVKDYEVTEETVEAGVTAAENLYTTNPEIQLFLTVNNSVALGISNYYTALSSPVTDYSKMGVFTMNGDDNIFNTIKASGNDETPLRGTMVASGIPLTIQSMKEAVYGILDETIEVGSVIPAKMLPVNADTVDEYFETGDVTTINFD